MQSRFVSPLLLAVLALMGFGLVQVYSSSYFFASEMFSENLYFFKRQLLFVGLGLCCLIFFAVIPLVWIKKTGWLIWVAASVGVILTFVPGLASRAGGAARWLKLPMDFRFEPSELLKFSFALLVATLFIRSESYLKKIPLKILIPMVFVPVFLLLKQPDFGSFAIIVLVGFSILFAFGLKWRWIALAAGTIAPAFYFLVMNVDYRRARILSFLDPWADPASRGFQVIQSMLSFHSGGITGVGLGQSQGKLFFLPEAHTDFTVAILGEELGFLGFTAILLIYGFIIFRGIQLSIKSEDVFSKTAALGITMTFAFSVFINVGVALGMLPTKGLTLPFLSYGGSSLVVLSLMFGILINIERNIHNWSTKSRGHNISRI
jgi:cell division protein FtsW